MGTRDLAPLREQIILDSVKRLNRLGFQNVDKLNILEDDVYKVFFFRILLEKLGKNPIHDGLIKELILEVAQ